MRVKKNDFDKLMYQAKYLSYYYSLLVNDQLSSDEAKANEQTLVFLVENEIARQIRKRAKYSKLLRSYRIAPADEALAEDPTVKESESATAIATQSQYAELTPGITAMNSVWEPIDAALQTIATGKDEPKTALPQAVDQIKSAILATQN